MIYTPHFVFLHVPKTGGTWFRNVLSKKAVRKELGVRALPWGTHWFPHPERLVWGTINGDEISTTRDLFERPRILFVRNPWDWYVSLFHHWFDGYRKRGPRLARWAERLARAGPDPKTAFPFVVRDLIANEGSWQARYQRLAETGSTATHIGRFESLRTESVRLMEACGATVPPPVRQLILTRGKRNETRKRRPYSDYYDAALRDHVAEAECEIIERFGYVFGV